MRKDNLFVTEIDPKKKLEVIDTETRSRSIWTPLKTVNFVRYKDSGCLTDSLEVIPEIVA